MLKLFNPLLGIRILTQHRDLLMQILKRNIASRYRLLTDRDVNIIDDGKTFTVRLPLGPAAERRDTL